MLTSEEEFLTVGNEVSIQCSEPGEVVADSHATLETSLCMQRSKTNP